MSLNSHLKFDLISSVNSILIQYGFRCTMLDHSVFIRSFTGGVIVLIVSVDDIIIFGSVVLVLHT